MGLKKTREVKIGSQSGMEYTTGGQMEEGRTKPCTPNIRYPELGMFVDISLELQTRQLVTLL